MPADRPRQGVLRQAWRIAWKDLQVELRSREIVYTMAFFGAVIVVVYSFAFPASSALVRLGAPGLLWVSTMFAGTIGLGRAFDRERENDTLRALMLTPVPRLAIFLGKGIAITFLVSAVALVVTPLMALLMDVPFFDHPGELALALLLGAVGFSAIGTVFAATLLKVRSRDVLLPVIIYPILIPLFAFGTEATAALLKVPADLDNAWYWIGLLGAYDAAFLVLSMWIFESLVIE